jgi:hypothetical protein
MKRQFGLVTILAMIATFAFGSAGTVGAAGTTVVVSPTNQQGWVFYGSADEGHAGGISTGEFVDGPGGPGSLGSGSVHFTLGNSNGGELIATTQFAGLPLSSLTTLAFSTFTTSSGKSVALEFDIDYDPGASCATLIRPTDPVGSCYQGRFVYIPAFDNGSPVVTNAWQSWNTLDSAKNWYASHGVPGHPGMCTQNASSQCSLADLLAVYPHAAIMMRSGAGNFGVKAGSGYSSFDGNMDNIRIGASGADTTFDFENHTVATDKNQCKDGGWQTFNPPTGPYKNQGQCVSSTNH